MGGLDIFKAEKMGEDKWANVTNMKYPINSAADDFGIIFEGKKERGYLSSNRDGSKGQDDIWSFVMPPMIFTLDGVVKDCDNGEVIPDVVVKLVGSDGSSVETKTDKAGHYLFAENGNDRYILIGNTYTISTLVGKDIVTNEAPFGFFNSSEKPKISTVIEEKGKSFTENFCLKPITKEVRFPRVEYDLGKANLRSESKDSLNFLYQTLIDNPTFVIELSAHTDYRDTDASNLILSEHRADSCVAYLVSKGIPAERMKPKGWGESVPSTLTREMKLPSGKLLPVGTILSEKWIDKEVSAGKNKDDYEYVMQSNRRTVFSVLSKDYVNPNAPKEDPKKKKKTDDDDDE
jgi:peptidoglycan-associated lipoprotein